MTAVRRFVGMLVLLALAAGFAVVAAPAASAAPTVLDTYVLTFKAGTDPDAQAAQLRAQGRTVKHVYRNVFPGVAVTLPAAALPGMRNNPRVQRIEPDGVVTASDVRGSATWGLDRSDQRALPLDSSFTYRASAGAGVTAYIIDTGIRATHTDLGGRVASGYTAIADGRGTDDCNGHGTHVSGTVAGTTWGMANRATLVPVRVLDCGGSGSWSGVIAGLDYVAGDTTRRPAVANMSLGGGVSSSVNDAVQRAITSGVTVAVAAGNSNADACGYSPASTPNAITVGSTTNTDARSSFSNFGTCVDIFAPGSSITSSWNTSDTATNTISGTSMATPHVAGAAALILGESPLLTPAQVAATMLAAATPNVVGGAGTGSPNLLMYADPGPLPPPPPVPANDPFASPEVLTASATGSVTNNTLMASKETGEPNHAGIAGGASIWYSFTPPSNGVVTMSTQGSSFNTLLAAYTGSSLGTLTPVASNDDNGSGGAWSSVVFAATAGTTYRIAVDGYGGNKGSVALAWTFDNKVAVTSRSIPSGMVGVAYSSQLTAIGGSGSYTWSVSSGTLPAGLTLSSSGLLAGTPTAAGSSTFTVAATDGSSTGTATLAVTIALPPPPNDPFASAESFVLTSTGTTTGTSVNSSKETGEPYHAGYAGGRSIWYRFTPTADSTVTLTTQGSSYDTLLAVYTGTSVGALTTVASNDDSGGLWSSVTFIATGGVTYSAAVDGYGGAEGAVTLNWTAGNSVIVQTTSLPAASALVPYSAQLVAAGGTGTYTWSVSAGSLPAGLSLSTSGLISGTPTTAQTASFTVAATDGSTTGTKALSLLVNPPAPANDPFAAAQSFTLSASGSLTGTNVSATKETGEPNHVGNAGGRSVWYVFTAPSDGTVTLSTQGSGFDTLLAVYTGTSVGALTQIAANDDSGGGLWSSVTFSATSGTTYRIAVDGYSGASGSVTLGWTSTLPLSVTTASLPAGTVGVAYSAQLEATGATPPYTWALASGSLPAGVSLGTDGALTGNPTTAGTASFSVRVTSGSVTATKALSIVVTVPVSVTTASLTSGVVGTAYSAQLAASGGTGPYTWALDAGSSLPAGMTLSSGGAIGGTPTTAGTTTFTVQATDSIGRVGTRSLALTVVDPVSITTASLAGGVTGTAYSNPPLAATGGTGTYTWSVTAGALPGGVSLSSAGVFSGTPTATGTFTFTVKATSGPATATKSLSIVVTAPLVVSTASLPGATINVAYSSQLTATGGTSPYTWALETGSALPAGLGLSSGGLISGTPTATGTTSFVVKVTGANSVSATKTLSISVTSVPVTAPGAFNKSTPASNARNVVRTSVTFTWAASSGAASYEFCLSSTTTCGTGSTGWISAGSATTITRTGLNKATYYWQVRAVNAGGTTLANSGTWWKFQTA